MACRSTASTTNRPSSGPTLANPLLDKIESIPVVLVVAADLRKIVATDADLDRAAIVPGASIYPFCWNLLLAARARGLGGVMTTMIDTRRAGCRRAAAGCLEHHALAATMFLGHPVASADEARPRPGRRRSRQSTDSRVSDSGDERSLVSRSDSVELAYCSN